MPEIAYDVQVDALDAILGRVVEVGLSRTGPDDEEDDPNYKRRPISFGAPRRDAEGRVLRTNGSVIRFAPYAMAGTAAVSWWVLYDARGEWVMRGKLDRPVQYDRGEEPFFPDGFLKVWIP